jgi:hypothetical protein
MAWNCLVRCLLSLARKIERFTRSLPFSDFPVVEYLSKLMRVVPTLLYMTIAPQVFYSKIHRYAEGKSSIVPPPATFANSIALLFIIGLFKSENEARFFLALAVISSPVWIYLIIVITYVFIFLNRPLLHYVYIFQPFWRGPELSVMFSPRTIGKIDGKLLARSIMFLATQCFLAIPIAFMPAVGITILVVRVRPELYPEFADIFGQAFAGTLYFSAILLTWLVARPAAYMFLYCLKIPTPQVLQLTIFRKLYATMEENDNFRFVSETVTQKVRSELDEVIIKLRKQERKVRAVSSEAYSKYLVMRTEMLLDPLYKCLDGEKDASRINSLRTVAIGRSLLTI